MSADIDFSQFRRKSPQSNQPQQVQGEDLDFSQFMRKPKRTNTQKAGRIGMQLALGAAERAALPYELAVAPLANRDAQHVEYRKNVFEDIERLAEQKSTGVWDEQDQKLYDSLVNQIKNPEEAEPFVKTKDIGIRGLFQGATGIDTHPEGGLEKAANWTGFLKNPKNATKLLRVGVTPKDIFKEIVPGKKSIRGLTAGTAMQLAEDEKLGPLGTIAAAVVGDLAGGGLTALGKAAVSPKKTLANTLALFSKNTIKKELAEASKGKEFTKDLGTLTDNHVIKMIQARLSASGLVGKPLEELRKKMVKEIVDEYDGIAKTLGESRFQTLTEAGEVGKEALTSIRDAEKGRIGSLYQGAMGELTESSNVNPTKLASSISKLKAKLAPGSVKSSEQKAVLNVLENLEKDLYDAEGQLKPASVQNLINNKAALNDIINYEVQGGQKQLLKGVVHDVDNLVLSYGANNREFLKKYAQANKDFGKHARDFRNENINKILMSREPTTLMNKMNTVQGIRDLRQALSYTPEGDQIFKDLARKRMDMMFGDNFGTGLKDQLKFGTFSNVMKKGKNRELLKEILPKEAFHKLEKLQAHAGELAETANRFFNASQSATAISDLKGVGTILAGLFGIFTGNPWVLTGVGTIAGARVLSGLMADPKFLSLVEEAMNAAKSRNVSMMNRVAEQMKPYIEEMSQVAPLASKDQM